MNPQPIELPCKEYQDALYQVYITIFNQEVLEDQRINLMTPLFAFREWSWRVVGISEGAARAIKENNFDYPKRLNRDHFVQDRIKTFREMFPDNNKILDQKDWWKLFWKNDPTIVMSKDEHGQKNHLEIMAYPLSWQKGYFANAGKVGFRYRKSIEGAYLKERILCGDYLTTSSNAWPISKFKNWDGIN